jgi:hypothetical protein
VRHVWADIEATTSEHRTPRQLARTSFEVKEVRQ